MTRRRGLVVSWLTLVLGLGIVWLGLAGQGYTTAVYEGQITSVRIDKCGMQPGLCEGSILLARQGGEDTRVDVRIGTWIKRAEEPQLRYRVLPDIIGDGLILDDPPTIPGFDV